MCAFWCCQIQQQRPVASHQEDLLNPLSSVLHKTPGSQKKWAQFDKKLERCVESWSSFIYLTWCPHKLLTAEVPRRWMSLPEKDWYEDGIASSHIPIWSYQYGRNRISLAWYQLNNGHVENFKHMIQKCHAHRLKWQQ